MKLSTLSISLFTLLLFSCFIFKVDGAKCNAVGPSYTCPNCGGFEVSDCLKCDGFLSSDDLHHMCIDRKLFQPYNVDTEDHENHYHFLWQDIAAMLVWFFMGGIATACGVGGGGIYVPLGMLLLQFSPRQASGLSQCSIFGATLGGLLINIRDMHPAQKITDAPGEVDENGRIVQRQSNGTKDGANIVYYTRPRINYDMALYLAPLEMAGAVVGVLIQTFLPNWAFLLIAGIVLLFTSYKTYGKFGDARKKEKKAEEVAKLEKSKLEAETADTAENAETQELGCNDKSDEDKEKTCTETSNASCSTDDDNEDDHALRKKFLLADMRQYPKEKLGFLVFLWIGVLIITLLRGGRGVASLIGITCESPWFGILIVIQFVWLLGFAGFFATRLIADQKKRVAVRYPYQSDDTIWNLRSLRVFGFYTFLAGIIAGLIGIGGGMILGPMMLVMGVNPQVSTATTATMIVLTSSSIAIIFITSGLVPFSYAAFFFFVCFCGALFGKSKIDAYVRRTGRSSLLIFMLASIILFATFGCLFQMLTRLADKEWCFDGLNEFCVVSTSEEDCPVPTDRMLNTFLEGNGFSY